MYLTIREGKGRKSCTYFCSTSPENALDADIFESPRPPFCPPSPVESPSAPREYSLVCRKKENRKHIIPGVNQFPPSRSTRKSAEDGEGNYLIKDRDVSLGNKQSGEQRSVARCSRKHEKLRFFMRRMVSATLASRENEITTTYVIRR